MLGGVGLLIEDLKSLIQISLLTQRLNQWVVVVIVIVRVSGGGRT